MTAVRRTEGAPAGCLRAEVASASHAVALAEAGAERGEGVPASDGDGGSGGAKPPGKTMTYEYERVLTPSAGLRLHLNENTAGCSPKVVEALQRMSREQAAFYPDYDAAVNAGRVSPGRDRRSAAAD